MSLYMLTPMLILTLMFGCDKNSTPANNHLVLPQTIPAINSIETEQYAIYNAVLDTYINEKTKLLVIANRSPACENKDVTLSQKRNRERIESLNIDLKLVREKIPEVSDQIVNNFRSQSPICLRTLFNLKINYVLLSEHEYQQMHTSPDDLKDFWKTFYEKYPNSSGILTLSNIGFNSKLDQALVSVGKVRGSLDGVGRYFFLTKENGKWVVRNSVDVWYS